jgi:O-acetyl-ADP-ribose deacetylase (regulator of RNase III)
MTMAGDVFVAHVDITHVAADVIILSTSSFLDGTGAAFPAFRERFPGFEEAFWNVARANRNRRLPIGETFWVATPGHGRVRGVVVVVATGDGSKTPSPERARIATTAALRQACGQLPPTPGGERPLIALPTIGFGEGGYRDRLQCARAMIEAVAVVEGPGVDVLFCAYTDLNYQIMLQARQEAGRQPLCPVPDHPHLGRLLAALRDRRCVLFIGAGLSKPAGLRDWKGLLESLCGFLGLHPAGGYEWLRPLATRLGMDGADDFARFCEAARDLGLHSPERAGADFALDLAQWYVSRFGRDALASIVRREFGNTGIDDKRQIKPTLAHYLLLSLPVRLVLTTNFDDLVENTLTALRRDPHVVVEPEEVVQTGLPDQPSVVKFHGDANTGRHIVLTRDDFDGFFRSHPVMASFLQGLLLNQTFLFYGYGLRDPNTRQIYSHVAHLLHGAGRAAFAVSVDAPGDTAEFHSQQWEEQGLHILPMPGNTHLERQRSALQFLDWLARQTGERPDLLLANHVSREDLPATARMLSEFLRPSLETLGQGISRAIRDHAAANGRALTRVMDLLVGLGWRPPARDDVLEELWDRVDPHSRLKRDDALSALWLALAEAAGDDRGLRRHCLYKALRYSGQITTARRVREAIRSLD